jgi:hypothetical protein
VCVCVCVCVCCGTEAKGIPVELVLFAGLLVGMVPGGKLVAVEFVLVVDLVSEVRAIPVDVRCLLSRCSKIKQFSWA